MNTLITYIDLGNTGVINDTDLTNAALINGFSNINLQNEIGKAINDSNLIKHIEITRHKEQSNTAVVTINSTATVVKKLVRVEEAIIKWFSPFRLGLGNKKLRFFQLAESKEYINSIEIVID